MRSRPYTPPPPLPPILSELSTYLPNRDPSTTSTSSRRRHSEDVLPLSDLDPETSRLLPPQQRRKRGKHHVRIQGKLAPVRSVSVVNLRAKSADRRASSPRGGDGGSSGAGAGAARFDTGVSGTTVVPRRPRGRRSEDGDDGDDNTGSDETDDEEATRERDTQLRGYGIGGAGNIREPGHRRHRHFIADVVALSVVPILQLELRLDDGAVEPGCGQEVAALGTAESD
ncbi:hypothetical protein Hte_007417 [Hypoxylon texense]